MFQFLINPDQLIVKSLVLGSSSQARRCMPPHALRSAIHPSTWKAEVRGLLKVTSQRADVASLCVKTKQNYSQKILSRSWISPHFWVFGLQPLISQPYLKKHTGHFSALLPIIDEISPLCLAAEPPTPNRQGILHPFPVSSPLFPAFDSHLFIFTKSTASDPTRKQEETVSVFLYLNFICTIMLIHIGAVCSVSLFLGMNSIQLCICAIFSVHSSRHRNGQTQGIAG